MLTLGEFPGAVDPADADADADTDAAGADDRRRRSCGVSMAPAARTSGGRRMGMALGAADWEKDPGVQVFSSGTRRTTRSSPRGGTGAVRSARLGKAGRPGARRTPGRLAPVVAVAATDGAATDGAAADDAGPVPAASSAPGCPVAGVRKEGCHHRGVPTVPAVTAVTG